MWDYVTHHNVLLLVSVIGQSVVWYEYVCAISVSDKSVISDTNRMSNRLEIRHHSMQISSLCRHSQAINVNKAFFGQK